MTDTAPTSMQPGLLDFVDYDPVRPHPMFTEPQIAYIRMIENYLSPEELDIVHKLERFRIDLKSGDVLCEEIPGLRSSSNVMVIYIQRSSDKPYPEMMEHTIDTIAGEPMGPDMFKRLAPPFKISIGREQPFYPIEFGGYFESWREKASAAAKSLGVATGEWHLGKFVTSDDRVLALAALRIEGMGPSTDRRSW